MEIRKAEPLLIRAGFVLFTLALLTGLAVPTFLNQKMAVAAHLTGVMNALLLIALGLAWGFLTMSPVPPKLTLHGDSDEYGSLEFPGRIVRGVQGPSQLAVLEQCGHVPHREQQDRVLNMVSRFIASMEPPNPDTSAPDQRIQPTSATGPSADIADSDRLEKPS